MNDKHYSRRARHTSLLVLALFITSSLLQSVAGSVYYSRVMQSNTTVTSPSVILEEGTIGSSTIYTNSTSAKVRVETGWLSGWDKRVKITIDNNDIDTALSNFPVLIYLSNSSSGCNDEDISFVFDELQSDANRRKIAVTTDDGTSQIYVEIERWNDAREEASLWVKVPTISNTDDTELYLYYDRDHSDNTVYVGDPDSTAAENVWDSYFKAVHHMEEDPTTTINDSTSNNRDMTSTGGMSSGNLVEGKIGKGVDFDGSNDHYDSGLNQVTIQQFTLEAWIWIGTNNNNWRTILSVGDASVFRDFCTYNRILSLDDGALNNFGTAMSTGNWHYVVTTYDSSTNRGYINGTAQSQTYNESWGEITNVFAISEWGGNADYFDGILDEIRISNASRSASWIKATYESERDDLLDFESEEKNMLDYVDNNVDYIDNNTSNVDSSVDRGTHDNFTAQQYGPDSVFDTLEEENAVVSINYENSAESYSAVNQSTHNFNYALQKGLGNNRLVVVTVSWEDAEASASISSLTFGGTAMTKIADLTVGSGYSEYISLWYLLDSSLPSSGSYNIAVTVSQTITREIYMAVAEYSGVKQSAPDDYDTHANTASGNTAIALTAAANGSVVVAGVGEGGTSTLTNTNNINNLQEQILTSSGSALGHRTNVSSGNITVGWNSLNTREGMVGAVWQPAIAYNLDLEVQWINATYNLSNEQLCIYGGTMGAENIRVDVWTGAAWQNLFTALSSEWNNVSVSSYLTSSTFTIRFKGGREADDTTQDTWNVDATLLHTWNWAGDFNYVLKMTETNGSKWKVRLSAYHQSNIGRLKNCSICIYDGSNSTQIVILNGAYNKQTGPWYDLTASDMEYIWMHVEASNSETSYVYAYLEILVPNTTTYARYIITFEIA